MEQITAAIGTPGMPRVKTPSRLTITLYDLITAIQEVIAPDDDALVVATVVYLLRPSCSLDEAWHAVTCARQRGSR
jgi:hypothetical protein